jgi:hypothetical protein
LSFSSLTAAMDQTVASTFADTDQSGDVLRLTVHFTTGQPDVTLPVVVKNPAMEEDFVPGGSEGTNVVILWIPSSISTLVPRGSTATYHGVDYDIFQSQVDREGGQTVKLRKRTTRWDQ